jgi:hypothetical protein
VVGTVALAVAASGLVSLHPRLRRRAPGGRRRVSTAASVVLLVLVGVIGTTLLVKAKPESTNTTQAIAQAPADSMLSVLGKVEVRGRAPKTGYSRAAFGPAWADTDHNGCDTRNDVLRRDLTAIRARAGTSGCVVVAGLLADPYTGKRIEFSKSDAEKVQIDHVVALSDAWQTGAQGWSAATREQFANDGLELLAVDGQANQDKGDADAATWLPPQKSFRCDYVGRQVAVKYRYHLWVTAAERDAMARVLATCAPVAFPS